MSTSSNSYLRGQRKSGLLELAETVGLTKYVNTSTRPYPASSILCAALVASRSPFI